MSSEKTSKKIELSYRLIASNLGFLCYALRSFLMPINSNIVIVVRATMPMITGVKYNIIEIG